MKVKQVHAGRLYRVKKTDIHGIEFVKGGGHLWVAEQSGNLMSGNVYVAKAYLFRSVATGVVINANGVLFDSLGLEEADGDDA
jgi:hypothetical protein